MTVEEIAEIAKRVLSGPRTLAAVGPFSAEELAPALP